MSDENNARPAFDPQRTKFHDLPTALLALQHQVRRTQSQDIGVMLKALGIAVTKIEASCVQSSESKEKEWRLLIFYDSPISKVETILHSNLPYIQSFIRLHSGFEHLTFLPASVRKR